MSQDRFGGDLQEAKRELIKLGLERGHLTMDEIESYLPMEHLSGAELEVLRFTLEALGIEVTDDPSGAEEP